MVDHGESRKSLSKQDVAELLKNPSPDARVNTAEKLATQFDDGDLSGEERHLAEEIFRIMVKDAEVRVREALAENLKESMDLPRDVARNLASDVDSVALPVIQFSEVLTSDDLIEIVESQGPSKQKAVASRKHVDERVSAVIVERGEEEVVATLVGNEGAQISDATFEDVVEKFGDSEIVQKPMVFRSKLPITVAERLVAKVSEELQQHLVQNHELPPDVATDLIMQSREKATVNLSEGSSEDDVRDLIRQLKANGRLTPSIVLRAICMGDTKFFEYALAEASGVPVTNARILIHDSGPLGFKSLYEQAGQPAEMFPAARAAVDVLHETEFDGRENDRERFQRRMIERILTRYEQLGIEFEGDDLEYLLTKMSALPAESTAEA